MYSGVGGDRGRVYYALWAGTVMIVVMVGVAFCICVAAVCEHWVWRSGFDDMCIAWIRSSAVLADWEEM